MPEGDSVYQAAARLRSALDGQVLTRTDFRVPALATTDLSGRRVRAVRSVGKHLFIDLDPINRDPINPDPPTDRITSGSRAAVNSRDATPLSIHTHLKMEGVWQVARPGARWRRPAFTARLVLTTHSAQAVGFDLGIVEVTADPASTVAHLGPDLLGGDWDPAVAAANLTRDPARPIGEALLDQRVMAGVGNVFRCEACFVRGVLPSTPVERVDADAMVDLCHRLLTANRNRLRTTTSSDLRRDRLWVYGRGGRPCLRCGTPIVRALTDDGYDEERVVYYCPRCQR